MQRSNERITICDSRVALLGKVGHENFIKKDDFFTRNETHETDI